MDFTPVNDATERDTFSVKLKPGSVYVLSGPARYEYKHGIAYREEDVVVERDGTETRIRRGVRMSITLRRMKEGAEIIGPS
jgi:alkylated DNA repair dioxygenase AlkB